ncbi:hypothetical protein BHE74_00019717 [Ensete ventricosum]|nr:hypothetical protein GW17_00012201 [Ensete ventricosum]RWW72473.1 hypothetical protein BHE74_00019717 [Ensete ventricosum]RZS04902.1 hypothetical protein BHM03_00035299 [Ensete ventricosum]
MRSIGLIPPLSARWHFAYPKKGGTAHHDARTSRPMSYRAGHALARLLITWASRGDTTSNVCKSLRHTNPVPEGSSPSPSRRTQRSLLLGGEENDRDNSGPPPKPDNMAQGQPTWKDGSE